MLPGISVVVGKMSHLKNHQKINCCDVTSIQEGRVVGLMKKTLNEILSNEIFLYKDEPILS